MRNLLLLLILVATMATAQTGKLELEPLTGRELNEVTWKIENFTRSKFDFTLKGDMEFEHHSDTLVDVIQTYQKFDEPDKQVTFTFHTSPKDHRLYINSISITGNQELLIRFYVYFWNTTINLDLNQDGLVASNRYINDVIELTTGEKAAITVKSAK